MCVPTFGQSAGAEVVNVHDVSFQSQGDTLHRGLQLHAAVTDQHIHTAVTLHHLSHHVLHALHVTEVQDHQLWGKRLGRHNELCRIEFLTLSTHFLSSFDCPLSNKGLKCQIRILFFI